MAKPKTKKAAPKPPEDVASVIEIRKVITDRKAKLAERRTQATKEGQFNKNDPKYKVALKRVKRAQRKLAAEAVRLLKRKVTVVPAAAAAPAEAAPQA